MSSSKVPRQRSVIHSTNGRWGLRPFSAGGYPDTIYMGHLGVSHLYNIKNVDHKAELGLSYQQLNIGYNNNNIIYLQTPACPYQYQLHIQIYITYKYIYTKYNTLSDKDLTSHRELDITK